MAEDRIRISYNDSTIVDIDRKQNHLLVRRGNVIIAKDDDRFIPLRDRIYAFSKSGSDQDWVLPDEFSGKPLEVLYLTEKGNAKAADANVSQNRIKLSLKADQPVEIRIKR
jgi:hypothetical protein